MQADRPLTPAAITDLQPAVLIEAIRKGAHAKVDVGLDADIEARRAQVKFDLTRKRLAAAKEWRHHEKEVNALKTVAARVSVTMQKEVAGHSAALQHESRQKAIAEKKELKAHRRRLEAIRAAAEPRVATALSDDAQSRHDQRVQQRQERRRTENRQLRMQRKMLRSITSEEAKATGNPVDGAAVILQAARRGSLGRVLHDLSDTSSEPPAFEPTFSHRRLKIAMMNRLARRRGAITEDETSEVLQPLVSA